MALDVGRTCPAAMLQHYGLQATRPNPRSSHENGVAEPAHHRLKTALAQALIIRGDRDFRSVAAYSAFVQGVVDKSYRRIQGKLAEERPHLRRLPPAAIPESSRNDNWKVNESLSWFLPPFVPRGPFRT